MRTGELAEAAPDDSRVAAPAADTVAHLPREMAAAMVASADPPEEGVRRWLDELSTESVRTSRRYDETGLVALADGHLALAVSSQTNVVVELAEPVTVTRPLGRRAPATSLRFFADDPTAALRALRPRPDRDPARVMSTTSDASNVPHK